MVGFQNRVRMKIESRCPAGVVNGALLNVSPAFCLHAWLHKISLSLDVVALFCIAISFDHSLP